MADLTPCPHCQGTGLVPLSDEERAEAEADAALAAGQRFTASLRALLTELGHDPDDEWVGCLAGWAFLYRDNGAPLPPRPPDPAEFRTAPPSLYMTFGEAEDMRREHEARERWQAEWDAYRRRWGGGHD